MQPRTTKQADNWTPPQLVPFAGLGFDLAGVEQRATLLTLVLCRVPRQEVGWVDQEPLRWGYGLQLLLSREIRAG